MKRLLLNEFQFTNYKADIDSQMDAFYDHVGDAPEMYPCVVASVFYEFNGVDTCRHSFVYLEDFRDA